MAIPHPQAAERTADVLHRHESAIVDDGAEIGDGARVWHFVHVCGAPGSAATSSSARMSSSATGAVIGDDCKIQNNVSVYDDVRSEDGVFCGPSWSSPTSSIPRARVERKAEYRGHEGAAPAPRSAPIARSCAA